MNLPANISVSNAKLPATYEAAKAALAQCTTVDECKDWADKAAALASYARMAEDETLLHMAKRIQARAYRRMNEVLQAIDGRNGQNLPGAKSVGTDTFSRHDAAAAAGLSKRQQVTAARIGNVPEDEFEAAIEADKPPTLTKLAEMGRKPRSVIPDNLPPSFAKATQAIGNVREFAQFCEQHDPRQTASGVLPREADDLRRLVGVIDAWLDRFVINLGVTQ